MSEEVSEQSSGGGADGVSQALGVDIGGSAIKAAVVDVRTGHLATTRVSVDTPHPATPDAVAAVIGGIVRDGGWTGQVGVTYPGVIHNGVALSAANVDKRWIDTDVDATLTEVTGRDITVLNDADAAGLAEVRYGVAKGVRGVVMVLTFGTGIGSGLFVDGQLVPNTELGHVELDGHDAEKRAAASVKDRLDLSWAEWIPRVRRYLSHLEMLFTPDLFVVGGGVSKDSDQWVPLLGLRTPVRPAELSNDAGIVGAALAAVERRGE